MIPIGDIDLRHKIRLNDKTGVVDYGRVRACIRGIYSARVEGRKSTLTVAIYQGDGAEEQDIANHPNIIQIAGAATSGGIHATLFNDDLIPLKQFVDHYQDSHFLMVYIYAYCYEDFSEVVDYINSAFQQILWSSNCAMWIRHSTGRLCTQLDSNDYMWLNYRQPVSGLRGLYSLGALHTEPINMVIESLTLKQYHGICFFNLRQYRLISIPASTPIQLRLRPSIGGLIFVPG
ncbi:hypothetical protein B0H12DRAFT_235214 [Mycena haematopus]|nr:hypothetical protein B0H12DRAFT_235214 [Mycena haematopus]